MANRSSWISFGEGFRFIFGRGFHSVLCVCDFWGEGLLLSVRQRGAPPKNRGPVLRGANALQFQIASHSGTAIGAFQTPRPPQF
jgi:hypothetical protein